LISLTAGAAFGQYPATGNKQRLGFQTTGDGLVYRGRLSDTTAIKPANINNAFYLQDTINDKLYRYIKTNGGWQPVQGRVQKLGVGADGPSSAVLYLSDTDTEISSAVVVVDGLSTLQLPGVNNTVVGIVTVTTVQHGVTVTGTGLAVVTETAQGEDGQITISVIIPSGYVTPDMLQSGTVDTLTTISVTDATSVDTAYVIVNTINALELPWDGNSVVGYVASGGGIKNAVYLNVNGKNILIQGGGAMDMSANEAGDILTITSATNVVVQQVTGVGRAYSVVDAISTVRLPWDGNAILAVTEEFVSNDVTLTINDTTVTFKVGVTDGDKADIIVSGDTWTIDENAVQWTNLDQATRDSIAAAGFSMPVDSITFNNNESDPDSLELQYNYDKGSLVYGANGGVEIPILPGHWYVRNDTSVTLTKGTVVRATGTLGNSGRIKVKHMIADGSIDAMYLLGIAAHDIAPGDDGYVMWQGKIRKINTNAYTEGAVLYADDFIPGGLKETEPTGSNLKLPIAFVVHKATNGTLAVRIDPGSYLRDLHDVDTSGRVNNSVIRYDASLGYWKASATAGIFAGDTLSMLLPYFDRRDTIPVTNGGTGLTTFGGAGRVPYSTQATGLQFDTTFFVDPTNRNFIWGGGARDGLGNINIGGSSTFFRSKNGVYNVNIGYETGMKMNGLTSGGNVNVGGFSGYNMTTASNNVSIGYGTNFNLTTGRENIAIGNQSGVNNGIGDRNVTIGYAIAVPVNDSSNQLSIGNLLFGVNMDSTGTAIPVNGRVGVKVASPTRDFHVAGEMRVTDLDAGVNPSQLVGADTNGVFHGVTLGTGLTMSNDTLSAGGVDTTSLSNRIDAKVGGSGTLNYVSKFTSSNTIGNSLIFDNGTNIGIGTATPNYSFSFNGNAIRTISLERHTTSNTAGNTLVVQAGGSTLSSTDKDGGNLLLVSGQATGSGSSKIELSTATSGSSGTTDRTPTTKMTIFGNGNVGIGPNAVTTANRTLHIDGEVRITDLTTDTATRIVGADADGDLDIVEIGTGLEMVAGELKQKILVASDSLDFPSVDIRSTEALSITVAGAALSDPVTLGIPNSSTTNVNVIFTAYVSAADTVVIRATNIGFAAADPAIGLFKVIIHKY
jgi:hypothetical protein